MRFLIILLLLAGNGPSAGAADLIVAGQADWEKPWLPDLRNSGRTVPLPLAKRIDIVILGDGYLENERGIFENHVKKWQERFVSITPFGELRGAFRICGLRTSSATRVNAEQKSRYHIGAAEGKPLQTQSPETAAAVLDALDRLDINRTTDGRHLSHVVVYWQEMATELNTAVEALTQRKAMQDILA
jgi:hypothetical protein